MEWILDNFQLVIAAVLIVGYILRALAGNRPVEDDGSPGQPRDAGESESDEAERTRHIQEEIRRRILARQRGEVPVQTEQRRTVTFDRPQEERREPTPPPIRKAVQPSVDPLAESAAQAILERQRMLEEQMKLVRQTSEAASAGVPPMPSRSWKVKRERRVPETGRSLVTDLHGSGSLRRAIVLREVLGQPLGLDSGPLELPRR